MTNERIIFTNPDGSCGILIPSGEIPTAELIGKDVPVGATNARQITVAELPSDRLFRNAWDDSNPEDFIGLDLAKAQVIAHDMRRADRETKLTPLDKEEVFVTTTAERKAAIALEKTAILDANALVQVDIDNAVDEAALRTALSAAAII